MFQGDAAGDHETTYEGFETLVAVGTQAGKVLIYDVLGLLIHEIVMNKPVRAVEWVGDMSAPSILPTMESPLSPQPGPVIKKLMEGVGEVEEEPVQGTNAETEPREGTEIVRASGIEKKSTVSFSTPTRHRSSIWQPPNDLQSLTDKYHPAAQLSKAEVPTPRSSETMMSGALPVPSKAPRKVDSTTSQSGFNSSNVRAHHQARVEQGSTVPARRPRRLCASEASCCPLRTSASSSQDFFTPPSTRFPSVRKARSKNEAAERTVDFHPGRHGKRHKPLRISSSDSSSLLRNEQGNIEELIARSAGRLEPAKAKISRPAAAAKGSVARSSSSDANALSSLRSISRSYDSIPASCPMLNQLAFQGNVAKQSRATSKKRKLADVSPAPRVAVSSLHDFSSSLYSRSKSRVFRNHSKALDGGADAVTPLQSLVSGPRRSFSFEAGLHEVEALAEQRYVVAKRSEVCTGGKRLEINRLRIDNEALQQQISSLREEFKTLKDVLLQAETHRRWEACVS